MQADIERKARLASAEPRIAVRWRGTDTLTPDKGNARLHSARQVGRIADSIEAFGFNVPVLIDADGRIVAGHGRVLAARRLGLAEVPTIALDHLSEGGRRAFMIADNRLAELASWDGKRLGEELEALTSLDLDFDLSATGFEIGEIDLGIGVGAVVDDRGGAVAPGSEPGGRAHQGRDRGPRHQGQPVVRAGETWALGRHRLVCGDDDDESARRAAEGAIRRWQSLAGEEARLCPTGESFGKVARSRRRRGAASRPGRQPKAAGAAE